MDRYGSMSRRPGPRAPTRGTTPPLDISSILPGLQGLAVVERPPKTGREVTVRPLVPSSKPAPASKPDGDIGMWWKGPFGDDQEPKPVDPETQVYLDAPQTKRDAALIYTGLTAALGTETSIQRIQNMAVVTFNGQRLGSYSATDVNVRRMAFQKQVFANESVKRYDFVFPDPKVTYSTMSIVNLIRGQVLAVGMMRVEDPLPGDDGTPEPFYTSETKDHVIQCRQHFWSVVRAQNSMRKEGQLPDGGPNYDPQNMFLNVDRMFLFGRVDKTTIPGRGRFIEEMDEMFEAVFHNDALELSQQQREPFATHIEMLAQMLVRSANEVMGSNTLATKLAALLKEPVTSLEGAGRMYQRIANRLRSTEESKVLTRLSYRYWEAVKKTMLRRPDAEESDKGLANYTDHGGNILSLVDMDDKKVEEWLDSWIAQKNNYASPAFGGVRYTYKDIEGQPALALMTCYIEHLVAVAASPAACGNWFGSSALNYYVLHACTDRLNWTVGEDVLVVDALNAATAKKPSAKMMKEKERE